MPSTRPTTRIQRRAQPTASRRRSSRRSAQPQPDAVVTAAASISTTSSSTLQRSSAPTMAHMSEDSIQRIAFAVSQAVMSSLGGNNASSLPPSSDVESRELPVAVSGSVCPDSGKRTDASGLIQSPGFPSHYVGGLSCKWTITTYPGYKIRLTARNVNLQKCPGCGCDKIAVFDGDASEHPSLGNWCTTSFDLMSTGINLHIVFTSNFDFIGGGFKATYITIADEEVCLMTTSKESDGSGTISTFNYPNAYPGNLDCEWDIRGISNNNVIKLDLDSEDVQFSCVKDVFQVYDLGQTPFAPWCGSNIRKFIFSSGPRMLVKFQTDSKSHGRGFMAKYRLIKKNTACSGTGNLTSNNGKLKSPDYQYGKHQVFLCQWLIKAPENYEIHFSLTYQSSSHRTYPICSKHFVEVFDGSFPTNRSLGRFCENTISHTIDTDGSSSYVMLWIDSDLDANERPNFSANYRFFLKTGGKIGKGSSSSTNLGGGAIAGIVIAFVGLFVIMGCVWKRQKIRRMVEDMRFNCL